MIKISDKPIDIQACIDAAQSERAGAIDVFIGTVRNHNNAKEVVRLEFPHKRTALSRDFATLHQDLPCGVQADS